MPWYAASAIMLVKFKDGNQDSYPVWENVHLIQAASPEEAEEKATKRAKNDEGDHSGTFTWNERPARWDFAGLRKLVTVSNNDFADKELDGAEVTFSEFEVKTEGDLASLVNGEDVCVMYRAG
jgi:hypothetical protein